MVTIISVDRLGFADPRALLSISAVYLFCLFLSPICVVVLPVMSQGSVHRLSESRLTLGLGLLLLGNAFAQKLSEIISVSGFFSNVGVNQIIWVWMIDGVLMLVITSLQSLIIDRHNRRELMEDMVIALALAFAFLQILMAFSGPAWLSQSLLFLLSQQQWLTFPLIFWVFTNDLLGINQAKRLIPKIASYGFSGYALGISFVGFTSWGMQRLNLPHNWMVTLCLTINISGAVSQFLAQPLMNQLGLKTIFALQPLFSLVASSLMIAAPNFMGSLIGIFLQKSTQYGVDEPARKALQALVPQERRGRVSNFIDGYMIGLGGILGALIIAMMTITGWLTGLDLVGSNLYLVGAIVASVVALISTWKMYQTYNISMLDWRLHRRKRGDSVLDSLDF